MAGEAGDATEAACSTAECRRERSEAAAGAARDPRAQSHAVAGATRLRGQAAVALDDRAAGAAPALRREAGDPHREGEVHPLPDREEGSGGGTPEGSPVLPAYPWWGRGSA